MVYVFSQKSEQRLATCHEDLQAILREVIKIYDFSILEGHRTLETQQKYFSEGKSRFDGMVKKSKHQFSPSMAVDIMPWKAGTNAFSGHEKDLRRFYFLIGIVRAVSERLLQDGKITHRVRFGLDWDGDHNFRDQNFDDLPHVELVF